MLLGHVNSLYKEWRLSNFVLSITFPCQPKLTDPNDATGYWDKKSWTLETVWSRLISVGWPSMTRLTERVKCGAGAESDNDQVSKEERHVGRHAYTDYVCVECTCILLLPTFGDRNINRSSPTFGDNWQQSEWSLDNWQEGEGHRTWPHLQTDAAQKESLLRTKTSFPPLCQGDWSSHTLGDFKSLRHWIEIILYTDICSKRVLCIINPKLYSEIPLLLPPTPVSGIKANKLISADLRLNLQW